MRCIPRRQEHHGVAKVGRAPDRGRNFSFLKDDATTVSIETLYRTGTRDIDLPSACIKADDVGCGGRNKSDQTDCKC